MEEKIKELIKRSQNKEFIKELKNESEFFVANFKTSFSKRLLVFCDQVNLEINE